MEIYNNTIIIESHYFPSLEYFLLINTSFKIILVNNDVYQKQEYRNRCYILGANKVQPLTVPVHAKNNMNYDDVRIDYSQNWLKVHLRTIKSAYSNAPYFEHYYPLIEQLLFKKHEFLIDMNLEILTLCLKLLDWEKEIIVSSCQDKKGYQNIKDFRNRVSIKKKDSKLEGILSEKKYQQLFGNKFVSNLSILDLLFNEGLQASDFFSIDAYNNLI